MSLVIASLDFHRASTDERQQFAFSTAQKEYAYTTCGLSSAFKEMVILSTCNRVEIIGFVDYSDMQAAVEHLFGTTHPHLTKTAHNTFTFYRNEAAVEHLIRVCAGLKSMVMGEPQIFGQVKEAYHHAKECGCLGKKLDFVFQHAFTTAKRIRNETSLGHCPVSVAFSSVRMMSQEIADLSDKNILILGAGAHAKLILKHLAPLAPKKIWVANRTLSKAETLCGSIEPTLGAQPVPLSKINDLLPQMDIVLGTSASEQPLLKKTDLPAQRARPLFCLDTAIPRDIAADVATLDYCKLVCLDDIQKTIDHNTLVRTQAATQAEIIIEEAMERYHHEKWALDHGHHLVSFRQKIHNLKKQELAKALTSLEKGADPEKVLTAFAKSLTNKILHEPSDRLYRADVDTKEELCRSLQLLWGQDTSLTTLPLDK